MKLLDILPILQLLELHTRFLTLAVDCWVVPALLTPLAPRLAKTRGHCHMTPQAGVGLQGVKVSLLDGLGFRVWGSLGFRV